MNLSLDKQLHIDVENMYFLPNFKFTIATDKNIAVEPFRDEKDLHKSLY